MSRIPCPKCRAEGRDSKGDHLRPFEDGKGGWCFHGHGTVFFEERSDRVSYEPKQSINLVPMIQTYPIMGIPSRKISEKVCNRYGIRSEMRETDGEQSAVYYPYCDTEKNVIGYKRRELPKTFTTTGKIKGLFGQSVCKNNAKFLIIVEGEQDVLAVAEMMLARGKDYNVVSLPNGANEDGTLDKTTLEQLEWITAHEKVCLMLDNDKPGHATATGLAETLCSQCTVHIAHLPRKDSAQCWEEGLVDEWWKALANSQPYHPESIVEGKEITLELLMTPKPKGFELPYPKLQRMVWGLRKGEVTTLTAGSGIGKSTFALETIFTSVLTPNPNTSVAVIALETGFDDVGRKIVALDCNIPWFMLAFDPYAIPTDKYRESVGRWFDSNRVHLFRHWGAIDSEVLRRKMLYYAKVLKVDFIVLDHVSMVVAGADSDERKDIDKLYESMTRIVVETGIGIIPIIHLKRVNGKSFNKGDEVELTDLRGSAGAEQMSWNVWALERNMQVEDGNKDLSRIRVLKNRTIGFTGPADTLQYRHDTGRLSLYQAEEY